MTRSSGPTQTALLMSDASYSALVQESFGPLTLVFIPSYAGHVEAMLISAPIAGMSGSDWSRLIAEGRAVPLKSS